ncbi:MAG: hypothetical protein ACTSRG_18820 [Candidatus Helarchaeota archaeon]
MKYTFKFNLRLLSPEKQDETHCNLSSPLHIAIYKPLFDALELKRDALLLGKNSIINVKISILTLPVKLGTYRDCFCHSDLKAFFQEGEEVFLLNFNDLDLFQKDKVIKPNKITRTRLMETISLKFPKGYQKYSVPGQIYFGLSRNNDQIWKFELVGYSNKFEISDKRDGISSISYFVAANKAYSAINERLKNRRILEPVTTIKDIIEQEKELKDKLSKKILQFYRDNGSMPSHIDLVSDKIGVPLGYEKQVLQYLFGPIKLNLDTISDEDLRELEKNAKKILNYVAKKRKQENETQELWQPLISDIIFDLKMEIQDLRNAFEYINIPCKDFYIKPEHITKIDKLSKIIINLAQKNNRIPTLQEVVNKGMSVGEAKKAFKVADEILSHEYPMWENELQIPRLLFPIDEMLSEHLDEMEIKPIHQTNKVRSESISKKDLTLEITPEDTLELQITKARFQRETENPILFEGNPELFFKRCKNLIENELTFTKVKENIISEEESFVGDLIYAYLDKKKQVHFSIQVSIEGNMIDETGKADLIIKSNDLSVADRFYNIFINRLEELEAEIMKDHFLSDSQEILQMIKNYGKGKNWTNLEELTIRLNYSPERAQRILDYMEQANITKKVERASTGVRYYFPGLT